VVNRRSCIDCESRGALIFCFGALIFCFLVSLAHLVLVIFGTFVIKKSYLICVHHLLPYFWILAGMDLTLMGIFHRYPHGMTQMNNLFASLCCFIFVMLLWFCMIFLALKRHFFWEYYDIGAQECSSPSGPSQSASTSNSEELPCVEAIPRHQPVKEEVTELGRKVWSGYPKFFEEICAEIASSCAEDARDEGSIMSSREGGTQSKAGDHILQIPSTCDRLREELHASEWTPDEWHTLRKVCREHLSMEIILVQEEARIQKHLEEKEDNELIDQFLVEHVQNVRKLGDEVRMRIMSGIARSFDLAINNPAGMVALVEAVEGYETANEEYKAAHGEEGGQSQTLHFTDMRVAALGELCKDFETRGLDVFREHMMQATDIAEEVEVLNQKFSAVLRAANELTSEIGVVKEKMAPCFPPNWAIETLWTTCMAHICSTNILQQLGGPDGHKLPDLTVTQLLDLVAWVENFREIIEDTFPNIGSITSSRTYLDKPPKLLVENSKTIDIEVAKDSLAWVNNTLCDVHDLAKDEFVFRTKEQTEEWLDNIYE